jgi:hypothetical protein
MKESLKQMKETERGRWFGKIAHTMKVNGLMEFSMDRARLDLLMELIRKDYLRIMYSFINHMMIATCLYPLSKIIRNSLQRKQDLNITIRALLNRKI